jgi:hypothetical protein
MMGRRRKRRPLCACGFCAALREARRRLTSGQNHPHYAARGNEQPLLADLVDADPPEGGLASFIADLNRRRG